MQKTRTFIALLSGLLLSSLAAAQSCPDANFILFTSGTTVSFFDQSSISPSSWQWDFGDGNTSTARHPNHSYAIRDTYTICLIVTNNCGADTLCKTIDLVLPPCTPDWSFVNTGANHTILIPDTAVLTYFGGPLPHGTYIGAFYLDQNGVERCGGYLIWQGNTTAFPAFGDDATTVGVKEGFAAGEVFRFRIHIPCQCEGSAISMSFRAAGGVFTHDSTYTTNGISALSSLSACAVLASDFLDFRLEKEMGTVSLFWEIYSEKELVSFEIHRNTSGLSWEKIAQLASSESRMYSFYDLNPQSDFNAYRILVREANGSEYFSNTQSIYIEKYEAEAIFYPNPASDYLKFKTASDVIIYNALGQEILRASGQILIDISQLPAGIYVVERGGERQRLLILR